MTPQERQLVDELFDRLSKLENAQRDPDATAAISDGLRKHLVGAQHGAQEQQRKNHRPRELGGGESNIEEGRRYHGYEPKNGVPLSRFFFSEFFIRYVSGWGCCGLPER
mgnify:CR=1 FL=1